jgi:hypothetical protein
VAASSFLVGMMENQIIPVEVIFPMRLCTVVDCIIDRKSYPM